MELKAIEKIIENLNKKGFKTEYQKIEENNTEVHFQSSQIIFQHNTNIPTINLALPIHYDMTFDQTNIDYLNSKDIKYWEIHKHWLEFTYQAKNEKDLEKTLEELLETYDYN